jgi:hypothetical protein
VTNTVPPAGLDAGRVGDRLVILDAAPIFAEAIRRCHEGGSITELLAGGPGAVPRHARAAGDARPESKDAR